jgi:lipopolysaccharide/colanic/teichoic acid biosynthesis glycosyltransferase
MNLKAATNVHEAHVEHLIRSNKPMVKLDVTGDSRLIKGGCLIRTSGLDELPQFINVLRGEMSLVGPRPCLPNEFELYDAHQRHRFAAQPGLTGLWQVSRTHSTTFSEMVKMDNDYVDHLTPMTDLKIILETPFALLAQMKACWNSKAQKSRPRLAAVRPTSKPQSHPEYALAMSSTQRISN